MNLKILLLSERSQSQRITHCMLLFIWTTQNRQSQRQKVDAWFPRARRVVGSGEWVTANGDGISFRWDDENRLKLMWLHNFVNILNTVEFHTLKGWIVWNADFISIKLLLRKRRSGKKSLAYWLAVWGKYQFRSSK